MDDNLLIIGFAIGLFLWPLLRLTYAVIYRLREWWGERSQAQLEDRVISRTVVTFDDEQQMNEAIAAFDRGDISPLMRRANGR